MESNININRTQVQNDEISFKELILKICEWCRYLSSKWKLILSVGVLGSVLGFTYAYFKKPIYAATCTFVLDEGNSAGRLSQYAGIAAMAGVSIGSGASEGLFQGDNIMELYKSRTMLQKTLLSYGEFDGRKELLVDRYIKINNLREAWSEKPDLKNLAFDIPLKQFTRINDSVMTVIIKDINKKYLSVAKPDRKLSIVKVDVKSQDEQFAKNFNDAVVENVNQFYVETKTKKSTDNMRILQRQADSVRAVLNASISGTASAIDANPNANMALQILRVPSQRKQIDVQANSAMYAEIVKNLELAKLGSRQDAPLIQVVDGPVYPLQKVEFGRLKGFVLGGVLASCLAIMFLSLKKLSKNIIAD